MSGSTIIPLGTGRDDAERFNVREVRGEPGGALQRLIIRHARLSRGPQFSHAPRAGAQTPSSSSGPASASTPPVKKVAKKLVRRKWLSSRYQLESVLGRGGMGEVYKARDTLLDMDVAVKVLNPSLSRDRESVKALKNEARTTMHLSHRHIVRLFGFQKSGTSYFLVMEYVQGNNLAEILSDGPLALAATRQVAEVCGSALAHAHRNGILHNDLKPENVMVSNEGILKLIDFGVTHALNARSKGGLIAGTPAYMSPEQLRCEELDVRADVYSFGALLWELLSSHAPFPNEFGSIEQRRPHELHDDGIPGAVATVLQKAMANDRSERWDDVVEFVSALDAACGAADPE